MLNGLYLADLAVLVAVSWFVAKRLPEWGWVLAGIYIWGPFAQMAPAIFVFHPNVSNPSTDAFWTVIICLLPPLTLWLALLNGTIVVVLAVTIVLSVLILWRLLR